MFNNCQPPPDNTPAEVKNLCNEFGLHAYMGVLCGWQWAIEHKSVIPEYKVELSLGSTKQTINTDKADVMNKVMKIYRK